MDQTGLRSIFHKNGCADSLRYVMLLVGLCIVVPTHGQTVENPGGLLSAEIDPKGGESINREVGNFKSKQFNQHPHSLVFQFEEEQGFPPGDYALARFDGIRLSKKDSESIIDLDIRWLGTQRVIGINPAFQTSLGQFLWLGGITTVDPNVHSLMFSKKVYAVGFVLCRMQKDANARIKFYSDEDGQKLLEEYFLKGAQKDKTSDTDGKEQFVGLSSPIYGIQRVDIIRSSEEGRLELPLYLDDLAVILSPTGRPHHFRN